MEVYPTFSQNARNVVHLLLQKQTFVHLCLTFVALPVQMINGTVQPAANRRLCTPGEEAGLRWLEPEVPLFGVSFLFCYTVSVILLHTNNLIMFGGSAINRSRG